MPPQGPPTLHIHTRLSIHAASFTEEFHAVLMQPHSRRTYAAALTPKHWGCSALLCSTHAAVFFHSSHAAAFMLQLSRSSIFAASFTQPHAQSKIYDAAPKQGCLGVGWGGVLCLYISPKGVCDGKVKDRGWGWNSGQKETPSSQKETPSGQFIRKVGKSALELGNKKSIMQIPRILNLAVFHKLTLSFCPC